MATVVRADHAVTSTYDVSLPSPVSGSASLAVRLDPSAGTAKTEAAWAHGCRNSAGGRRRWA
ncbi:hypothetical protein ACFQZ4_51415 [Catellatospora coxensis]